ncbi:MAG: hypothetical protein ACRCW9_09845 [Cetobacterium sp.]
MNCKKCNSIEFKKVGKNLICSKCNTIHKEEYKFEEDINEVIDNTKIKGWQDYKKKAFKGLYQSKSEDFNEMEFGDVLIKKLLRYKFKHGLSIKALAECAEVNPEELNSFLKGEFDAPMSFIAKVLKPMKMKLKFKTYKGGI